MTFVPNPDFDKSAVEVVVEEALNLADHPERQLPRYLLKSTDLEEVRTRRYDSLTEAERSAVRRPYSSDVWDTWEDPWKLVGGIIRCRTWETE